MQKANKMKKISVYSILTLFFALILFSYGCVPQKVKKRADSNKKQYEDAFIKKVEEEMGKDYVLSDVEGYIYWSNWDFQWPGYETDNSLVGKIEHDGEIYDARYYFDEDLLYTDAYYREIIEDFANTIGLDKTKISCGYCRSSDEKKPMLNSNIRTAEKMFKQYKHLGWFFYIVTEEDISDIKYFDYSAFCEKNEIEYGITIYIYSTDNMTSPEHFEENYYMITGWQNENAHPVVGYGPDGEKKDVFDMYNLKGLT